MFPLMICSLLAVSSVCGGGGARHSYQCQCQSPPLQQPHHRALPLWWPLPPSHSFPLLPLLPCSLSSPLFPSSPLLLFLFSCSVSFSLLSFLIFVEGLNMTYQSKVFSAHYEVLPFYSSRFLVVNLFYIFVFSFQYRFVFFVLFYLSFVIICRSIR